jgi:HK97 family phage major capsid protein
MDDNVDAEIVAEHATGTNGADIVFGTATLGAYRYLSIGAGNLPLRVSVELLQDAAFDVQGLVSRVLGKRIARKQAKDFIRGTGSGMPLGIDYVVPNQNLATANPVTYAKLLAAVHGIDPDYRAGASWLMNDASLATIEGVVDTTGRPLLQRLSESGIAGRPSAGTLLGYPVVIDQAMPDIANATGVELDGAVIFGDLREAYVIREVKDVTLVVDPYTRAAYGEVQFTAWARADGTIQDRNAYVVLAGYDAP